MRDYQGANGETVCGCCDGIVDPNGECPCDWGWTDCQTAHPRTSEPVAPAAPATSPLDAAVDALAAVASYVESAMSEDADRLAPSLAVLYGVVRDYVADRRPSGPVAVCTGCAPSVPFDSLAAYDAHLAAEHDGGAWYADTAIGDDGELYCYCGHGEAPHTDAADGLPVCIACDGESDEDDDIDPRHAFDPYA